MLNVGYSISTRVLRPAHLTSKHKNRKIGCGKHQNALNEFIVKLATF